MAHPYRAQVPFTVQCGFYSQFFVNQGNAPHLALWVRTVRCRETKWWHQGHIFWQRMKLNPNPLSCGLAVTMRAVGRGSLGLSTGWKVLPCALCSSSLLKTALWFLLALFWLCFGLSGFPELTIMPSFLKWLLSITQCKTWHYKLAYKNVLLLSLRAFINYIQKYSKVVANSLDWFWLHKRQVISNYEN